MHGVVSPGTVSSKKLILTIWRSGCWKRTDPKETRGLQRHGSAGNCRKEEAKFEGGYTGRTIRSLKVEIPERRIQNFQVETPERRYASTERGKS